MSCTSRGVGWLTLLLALSSVIVSCSSAVDAPAATSGHTAVSTAGKRGAPDLSSTPAPPDPALHRSIRNFHVVHPWLWRGAAPGPDAIAALKRAGARTIVDLRISPRRVRQERAEVERSGMRFLNLPMSADPPTASEVKQFLAAVSDPSDRPVFVHCQHGADRTGTMVGIYRERFDGWSFNQAYAEMRRYGFKPFLLALKRTVRDAAAAAPSLGR